MQSDKAAGTAGGKEWAIITQLALMYLLIVGVILAIPTFTIQAQQKVMYVDMQKIISQTNQGKDLAEKFQAHYAEAQRDLQNYENRIATMVKEYERQRVILDEHAREAREQQILQMQTKYQEMTVTAEHQLQVFQAESIQHIEKNALPLIQNWRISTEPPWSSKQAQFILLTLNTISQVR